MLAEAHMRNPRISPVRETVAQLRSPLLSIGTHAALLLGVFGVLHTSLRIAPYKLPGTATGSRLITYYSPGSPAHALSEMPLKETLQRPSALPSHAIPTPPKPAPTGAPAAETGTGNSADSGLGEGDIRIAFQVFYPHPSPNLSALPHGTKGDVVLDALIDEHGNITGLTLLRGLGPAIDDAVIATVKQWTYTPATRNGAPIPSEQELRFHYERS